MTDERCRDCGRAIGFLGCESPGSRTCLQITNQRLRAEVEALRVKYDLSLSANVAEQEEWTAAASLLEKQLSEEKAALLRAERERDEARAMNAALKAGTR